MPVEFIHADILTAKTDLLVHGVNCQGVFGAGLAGSLFIRWPHIKNDYIHKYRTEGWSLGDIQFVSMVNMNVHWRYVVNCATQEKYGRDPNVVYCDYEAIHICVDKVLKFANRERYSVAMPRIGAGLAHGDWNKINNIIQSCSLVYPKVPIEVYIL